MLLIKRSPKSQICLLLVILCAQAFAYSDKDQWLPISPEEISMKTPKVDPNADAEAIFWTVKINDSSESKLSMSHYVRVKIFTERGREQFSKFDIPFTKRSKVKNVAARVIKADGSIIEIPEKDIFERDIIKLNKVKVKAKSFAVPSIEPGVIVEYRYDEEIQNGGANGMHLEFQRDIPVQNIRYFYKPFEGKKPEFMLFNFSGTEFVKDKDGYFLAERKNVPAMDEEARMPPEDNVKAWMLIQRSGIAARRTRDGGIQYTEQKAGDIKSYWQGVALEHQFLVEFMLKKEKDIKKLAESITASEPTQMGKLKKLYEYCQSEIKNTSWDSSLTDEQRDKLPKIISLKDVIENKQSPGMYIDLLFGSMASSLGMEADIVLASDREDFLFKPEMTNERFVNPSMVAVKVGEKWQFFNPGLKYAPFGQLSWNEEGVWAVLVGKLNFAWEKTPLLDVEMSQVKRTANLTLDEDGTLAGTVTEAYTGHPALTRRIDMYDETPAERQTSVVDNVKGSISSAEVSNVKVENIEEHYKPLLVSYTVRVPNYAQKTGKRLFLQPSFFEYNAKPVFVGKTRKHDIYFKYPWSENDTITIVLPKGFELDNAEAPGDVSDSSGIAKLSTTIGLDKANNALVTNRAFHFGKGGKFVFPVQVYDALKNIFDAFNKIDLHTISLKKQ